MDSSEQLGLLQDENREEVLLIDLILVHLKMEMRKTLFMTKILNKLGIKVFFLLFLTLVGCDKYKESYRGYAFVQVYETEGGDSNINFYLMDQYSKGKSFDQNIEQIQKIKTIILTTDNNADLLQHIQSLKSLRGNNPHNELIYYLVYVDFAVKKAYLLKKNNLEQELVGKKMDIEAYHYLVEDSAVEFHKFNVVELLKGY